MFFFIQILSHSGAHLWESCKLVGAGNLEQSPDGYISSPLSLRHKIQILLNTHCNDHMNFDDGTCCSYPEAATTLQLVSLFILALWYNDLYIVKKIYVKCLRLTVNLFFDFSVATGGGIWLYRKICKYHTEVLYSSIAMEEIERSEESNVLDTAKSESSQVQDFYTLVSSLAIFSIILAYFYLCDRYFKFDMFMINIIKLSKV